jgi:hypothetical protein
VRQFQNSGAREAKRRGFSVENLKFHEVSKSERAKPDCRIMLESVPVASSR